MNFEKFHFLIIGFMIGSFFTAIGMYLFINPDYHYKMGQLDLMKNKSKYEIIKLENQKTIWLKK